MPADVRTRQSLFFCSMCTHQVIVCNKQKGANFESEDTNQAVGRDKPVLKVDTRVGLKRSKAFRKLGIEQVFRQIAFATFGLHIQFNKSTQSYCTQQFTEHCECSPGTEASHSRHHW